MTINFVLIFVALTLELWLFKSCRHKSGTRFVIYLPVYCVIVTAIILECIAFRAWPIAFYLQGLFARGQEAILGLLCLHVVYKLTDSRLFGTMFAYLIPGSVMLCFLSPVAIHYFALLAGFTVLATVLFAPLGDNESYKWISLSFVALSGLQSLPNLLQNILNPLALSRASQLCWIAGISCVLWAVKTFPTAKRTSLSRATTQTAS